MPLHPVLVRRLHTHLHPLHTKKPLSVRRAHHTQICHSMTSNSSKWLSACWDVRRTMWGEIWDKWRIPPPLSLALSLSFWPRAWPHIKVFTGHKSTREITLWQGWRKTNLHNVSNLCQTSGTRRDHICVQLFPGENRGCKWSYGSIRPWNITIVMTSVGSCLVIGHSSCQIKRHLTYCPCHDMNTVKRHQINITRNKQKMSHD